MRKGPRRWWREAARHDLRYPVPAYAAMLKSGGVAGVFVNGTTGEGVSLTLDERLQLAEAWIAEKSDNFKVFIHLGYADQETSAIIAKHAAEKERMQ